MPLSSVVDSLDTVPEAARGFYTEQDGKFVLDVDVEAHPGVSRLKGALDKERGLHRSVLADLKRVQEMGSLGEIAAKMARLAELEKAGEHKDTLDLKALQKKWMEEHRAETEKLQAKVAEADAKYRRIAIEDRVRSIALNRGVIKALVDDVVHLTRGKFEIDDQESLFMVGEDGHPSSITPDKYFAEVYRAERPHFYESQGASGSGARTSQGGGSSRGGDMLTATQKIAAGLKARTTG